MIAQFPREMAKVAEWPGVAPGPINFRKNYSVKYYHDLDAVRERQQQVPIPSVP
jgi:hypothetical protein